jgi:hypothetical protein
MRPTPPSVGELVALFRRKPERRKLLELSNEGLMAASTDEDEDTRMLAEMLAVMTPGQRKLLRFKAR